MPISPIGASSIVNGSYPKILLYLYSYISGMSAFFIGMPEPFSHLLPVINFEPSLNLFIVNTQLFSQRPHLPCPTFTSNVSNSSGFINVEISPSSAFSLAINATPKAPIIPEISGLTTSLPMTFSMLLNTALFKKVPPWTTILSPASSGSLNLITLYRAFFITEYDNPAEISPIEAPSFCACFTFEFINTVHLVPRSTGLEDSNASFENSTAFISTDLAYVSINEPHPEEQASFNIILYMAPSLIFIHFIS